MTGSIDIASASDTCETLFASNPAAVCTDGTEQQITVMVPGTGNHGCYTIVRDLASPGRYTVRMSPGGILGDIEPGAELPGEVADIVTCGIPLRRTA